MSNTSPALSTPPAADQPLPATRAASDAPPPVRTGHCQCGRISYQVTGVPDDPHLCSCVHETRISGGPAVLWVGFPLDSLIWTGTGREPKWYATYPTLRRGFCPACVMQADSVSRRLVSQTQVVGQHPGSLRRTSPGVMAAGPHSRREALLHRRSRVRGRGCRRCKRWR
ncbi:GFA family protein [Streptomyces roseus]